MGRLGGGIIAAWLFLAGAAFAQAQPTPIDPQRLQLAREVYELTGGQQSVEQMLATMMKSVDGLVASLAPQKAEASKIMRQAFLDEFRAAIPEVMNLSVKVMAGNLTTEELQAYVAWLKSPIGRSIIAKQPQILAQTLEAQAPFMRQLVPRAIVRALARVCEQDGCTSDQREKLNAARAAIAA